MSIEERLARLEQSIEDIKRDIDDLRHKMDSLTEIVFSIKKNNNGTLIKIVAPLVGAIIALATVLIKVIG